MNSRKYGLPAALGLAALMLTAAVPGTVRAAWLGYRNETKSPIIVQAASIQRNVVRRGAAHLLYTRDVAWDVVLQPGAKVITVYDGNNPKRTATATIAVINTRSTFSTPMKG